MYVKLINEGSVAYQSVPSSKFSSNIYKLDGSDIYDIEDEIWEFLPAILVLTKKERAGRKISFGCSGGNLTLIGLFFTLVQVD